MIVIDSVELSFGDRDIISGGFLKLEKGEILGLLGRNGSGKSSLLKIIFGTLKAQHSHLRIDDKIVKKGFLSKQISYLPQINFLPHFLLVKELFSEKDLKDIPELDEIKDSKIRDLSAGKLRIVECLWVLNQDANYVLLDEPFSGLAPLSIELIQGGILEKKKEKGIVLTDHRYAPLLQVADRVVLMHNNSIYPINSEEELQFYNYLP